MYRISPSNQSIGQFLDMDFIQIFDNFASTITPMSMSAEYYLAIDIGILCLQGLSIFGNGFIIFLFLGTTRLRKNLALRLLFLLCVSDFVFAITSLPYIIYYVIQWNPEFFDYDPMFMVTSSSPLVIQFKLNLIITIMIAIDRLQAMKKPAYYRQKNHMLFVWFTFFIGIILGSIDLFLEYNTTKFNVHRYNCAAIGCFQESGFRTYWGISNMVLNITALILTILVAYELNAIGSKSTTKSLGNREKKQMSQANVLSFGILIVSLCFLMIPSTFVGIVEWFGLSIFKMIGPFYIIGLLLAGVTNSIIYITFHVELKQAAIRFIKFRSFNTKINSTAIVATTVYDFQ